MLEHNALESLGINAALISPELTRSSLWLTSRVIAALSPRGIDAASDPVDSPEERVRFDEAKLLPHIPIASSAILQKVIEFILSKVFTILTKLTGEEKFVFFLLNILS